MLVLDTNHLTVLQAGGPAAARLEARLVAADQEVATTIITVQEELQGWMAELNKYSHDLKRQVSAYTRLHKLLLFFADWQVLPFDDIAATRFAELRRSGLHKVKTADLKIASIVLSQNATLLSANLKDFRLVPDLRVADWIYGPE